MYVPLSRRRRRCPCYVLLWINSRRTCLVDGGRHLDNNVPRFPGRSTAADVKSNYRVLVSRVKGDVERLGTRERCDAMHTGNPTKGEG